MLEGILQALWLSAWADAMEEAGERVPHHITMESADPPPASAKKLATLYGRALALSNHGTLADIYERAVISEGRRVDPVSLGYYLTMEGLGHGVSWWDDHEEFPVKIPRIEIQAFKHRGRWTLEGTGVLALGRRK
jgi:hypothetical protein